jgi:hypothetical protein
MSRYYVIELHDNGKLDLNHDDFSGQELATFATILQHEAISVLTNGPQRDIPERRKDGN